MEKGHSSRIPIDQVIGDLTTKSAKIRALAKAGYLRTEISKILEIRYQHVRKVLVDAGIGDGLKKPSPSEQTAVPTLNRKAAKSEKYSWETLLKAGFQYVGDWELTEDGALLVNGSIPQEPGVYAIILEDRVMYVGLTLNGLRTRMDQYKRGHKGQKTSARVKSLILEALTMGNRIKVLIATPPALQWNNLPVNTSAGLEAGLIQLIRPPWNIQGA